MEFKKIFATALAATMVFGMTSALTVSADSTAAAEVSDSDFVTTNGNYFMLDGKPFYYGGTNTYYLHCSPDYMIDDVLDDAVSMHLKVIRCWGFIDGEDHAGYVMQPEMGKYDSTGFERLDYTINEASKRGIKLIIPFVNNWNDYGGMNQYVKWAGLNDHDDFYTDSTCKTAYKNFIKYLLNHVNQYSGIAYKDDPTVMSWELANEPRCTSDTSGDTLLGWADEMSTYIKSIDSNHLVTVGDEGFFNREGSGSDYEYNGGTGVDWDRLIELPNIDFETMHLYPNGWSKSIDWCIQYIKDHISKSASVGKPVILEEYGVTGDESVKLTDYKLFNDALYGSDEIGTGAAGSMFWLLTGIGWDNATNYPDYDGFRVVYPSDVAALLTSYADKMDEKSDVDLGNSSSLSANTATFDLNIEKQADIPVTVTFNGNTLTGIYNDTTALTQGTDYTVDDNIVTISKEYLAKQDEGTTTLRFKFSVGSSQKLVITITDSTPVVDSTISETTATFDKNPANIADVTTKIIYNGNTLKGIYNGTAELTEGKDYSIADDGTVTIFDDYLTQQPVGTTTLTFDFNKGADPTFAIAVSDTSPIPQGSLTLEMFNGSTQASTNGIAPRFRLTNSGSSAIDLSKVKIRYYYTEDGTQAQSFWCDWSSAGTSNITGTFKKLDTAVTGADSYLEIGFTSAAGNIAAGNSIEIQVRFAKSDWSNYDQSNDYSFDSTDNSYATWTRATVYINGDIQWGIEPAGSSDPEVSSTISSLEDITVETIVGTAPALPAAVKAAYSDGTTKDVAVTWDAVDESSYAEEGTFTVYGTVENTDLKAACTVKVEAAPVEATISSLEDATVETTVGTAPELPTTVKAAYSDGTTKDVAVTWNAVDETSYAEEGTFTVYGTVENTDLKAACTVTVKEKAAATADNLEVKMYNSNTQASTNGIAPRFMLTNTGDTAIDLSEVTLRYYFTEEGTQSQSFWCDWSSVGSSNVIGTFKDGYLEISFASGAGTLAPGASAEVQGRFSKSDWTNYDQSNDYSFNATGTSYVDWTKVTAYQNGSLIWGVEP